jgi:hypothetical protein
VKREVQLIGGPGDGLVVQIEHDQDVYRLVVTTPTVFRSMETVEMTARSALQVLYRPRRRGDYAWFYEEGQA